MIVIIGAGPAGLAASYFGDTEHLIIEQEAEIGGLCRSFELADCVFDLGGHAFFTPHADILSLLESKVPGGLYAQPRQAFVHSHGRWLQYPFQANLYGLPAPVVADCLEGLIEVASLSPRHHDNVGDWIDASFGRGIAKHFMRPYNEKVWGYPLDQIHPHWVGDRIVKPDVRGILEGALAPRPFSAFPNANVRYPGRGGYAALFQPFAPKPDRLVRGRVVGVDLVSKTLTLEAGQSIRWSALVSTMPLDLLTKGAIGATEDMRKAAQGLKWNGLYLASFALDGMPETERQRVYCADPEVPFHKLVLNSNSSPDLRTRTRFGIQAEVTFSPHKSVESDKLMEACWSNIQAMGLTGSQTRIAATDVRKLDRAYPIVMREDRRTPEFLAQAFAAFGVFCAGRFGTWSYINSDDAFVQGRSAIRLAEEYQKLTLGTARVKSDCCKPASTLSQ